MKKHMDSFWMLLVLSLGVYWVGVLLTLALLYWL